MPGQTVQVVFQVYGLPPGVKAAMRADSRVKLGVLGSITELGSSNIPQTLTAGPSETEQNVTNLNFFNGTMVRWGLKHSQFISRTCRADIRTRYQCQPGEVLAVAGSEARLGSWEPKNAIRAREKPYKSGCWIAHTVLDCSVNYHWKWVVLDAETGAVRRWEERRNRHPKTNCERLVVDARWNCESLIQHRVPVSMYRDVDMTKVNIANYSQMTCNAPQDVATKWIANANVENKYFAVTEMEEAAMANPAPVLPSSHETKKTTWRSLSRQLPALVPFLWFVMIGATEWAAHMI
ncbi:uncharacterized protein LOC125373301 [Haliotis rufescens]|uniref:uncharacterized protein LOC125373301 n=1 Tax=Haliotis rufescens TaxID=6454 RepID=UPI00201EAA54|nr:uncharacterized protein LOC125373301 [Haliotis rufescens]